MLLTQLPFYRFLFFFQLNLAQLPNQISKARQSYSSTFKFPNLLIFYALLSHHSSTQHTFYYPLSIYLFHLSNSQFLLVFSLKPCLFVKFLANKIIFLVIFMQAMRLFIKFLFHNFLCLIAIELFDFLIVFVLFFCFLFCYFILLQFARFFLGFLLILGVGGEMRRGFGHLCLEMRHFISCFLRSFS